MILASILRDDLDTGFRSNRYELLKELGKGCWFRVFEARDKLTGEAVALKILDPNDIARRQMQERWLSRKEAILKAGKFGRLYACAHLSPTFIDSIEGHGLVVVEPLYKRFLSDFLKKEDGSRKFLGGGLSIDEFGRITRELAAGLFELAKYYKLSHCDIKPDNIAYEDKVIITDFGTATLASHYSQIAPRDNMGCIYTRDFNRFVPGTVPTRHSDIYAFAALECLMATGHYPFEQELDAILTSGEHAEDKLTEFAKGFLEIPEGYQSPLDEMLQGISDIREEERDYRLIFDILECCELPHEHLEYNKRYHEAIHTKTKDVIPKYRQLLVDCFTRVIPSAEALKERVDALQTKN